MATTLNNLGTVQSDLGEPEAAKESYNEALEIYRRLAKENPAAYDQYVATTLNNLGTVQSDLGEQEAAKESYNEALEIYLLLAIRWPAAFGRNLRIVLRNYTNLIPEDANDRWWQIWKQINSASSEE